MLQFYQYPPRVAFTYIRQRVGRLSTMRAPSLLSSGMDFAYSFVCYHLSYCMHFVPWFPNSREAFEEILLMHIQQIDIRRRQQQIRHILKIFRIGFVVPRSFVVSRLAPHRRRTRIKGKKTRSPDGHSGHCCFFNVGIAKTARNLCGKEPPSMDKCHGQLQPRDIQPLQYFRNSDFACILPH